MPEPRDSQESTRMRYAGGASGSCSGSVLVLSIWTLLLLSMLAVAVGAHVSSNLDMTTALASRVTCASAARAGIVASIALISSDTNQWDVAEEGWLNDESLFRDVEVGQGSFSVTHEEGLASGLVVTNYGLFDEDRRINLNAVTNQVGFEVVRSLLETAGGLDESDAVAIATCLADWIDDDDEEREGGAETAYYRSLAGHTARNGRIAFPAELMLVKGMTPDIFSRIRKHVTIHGADASVNFNTASPIVIASVTGGRRGIERDVRDALAERILKYRESGGSFKERRKRAIKADLFGSGGPQGRGAEEWRALEWAINHDLFEVRSRHFGGLSTGSLLRGNGSKRRIEFVYDRLGGAIRAWHEY